MINLSYCPILWVSKLQRETALSTMESKINTLSHCCRELIPLMNMVQEIGGAVGMPTDDLTSMHVSVHKNNSGALILAHTFPPQFTPRSKFYANKTVWFREEVTERGVQLLKISTQEQLGDIFTKGLCRPTFEYLRKIIMGW